jgi:hypothetical protein
MPTMSHTPEQRKAWHAGKLNRRGGEGKTSALARWFRKGHATKVSAFTPRSLRHGLGYGTRVKEGESARQAVMRGASRGA